MSPSTRVDACQLIDLFDQLHREAQATTDPQLRDVIQTQMGHVVDQLNEMIQRRSNFQSGLLVSNACRNLSDTQSGLVK